MKHLLTVLALYVVYCAEPSSSAAMSYQQFETLIKNCPNPPLLITHPIQSAEFRRIHDSILNTLYQASSLPPYQFGSYLDHYMTSKGDLGTTAHYEKIYLLIRLYTNVGPEPMNSRKGPYFAAFKRVSTINGISMEDKGEYKHPYLWPLVMDKDGAIAIGYQFGSYTGPTYQAVNEFWYYYGKFGKRDKLDIIYFSKPDVWGSIIRNTE